MQDPRADFVSLRGDLPHDRYRSGRRCEPGCAGTALRPTSIRWMRTSSLGQRTGRSDILRPRPVKEKAIT